MTAPYFREFSVSYPDSLAPDCFPSQETLFRLCPQWNVKSYRLSDDGSGGFDLEIEHERTEQIISLSGKFDEFVPGKSVKFSISGQEYLMDFSMSSESPVGNRIISFNINTLPLPSADDISEYDLWARSILNYIDISRSSNIFIRIWKWFVDRFWLKLTQSGKRIVLFIVIGEGFSFFLLIAVLLWWKFFSPEVFP
jgi:hypothetical protein